MLDNRMCLIDFITDNHCSVYEANLVNTSSDSDDEIEYDSDIETSSDSDSE